MIRTLALPNQVSGNSTLLALPHVLLVIDQLPRSLGGGERIALKIAGNLPRYGYRASILTLGADPQTPALHEPPCPIYCLPLTKTYNIQAAQGTRELVRFLKSENIRVVQTFFESSDLWVGGIVRAMTDAALIWSRRDMGILRDRKHKIAYRLMNGLPDAVLAVSEEVRRYSIEIDGIDPSRVHTVHNGLDLAGWNEPGAWAGSNEMVIGTVGNIRRVKGHDVLIRAAAVIGPRFPNAIFSIAGEVLEQDYFQELQDLIHEFGLKDRVRFAGGVKDLRAYLAGVDIFVLPSRSEGFSNAIIEAMAASLPVVATDVGGNAEAVHTGNNGVIVPSDDAGALAAAITSLLEDPAKAVAMGTSGRRIVEEQFTTDAMMRRITTIYADVLAGK